MPAVAKAGNSIPEIGDVIDPLGRIADVAARLERESTDDLASYDLKEALQPLT